MRDPGLPLTRSLRALLLYVCVLVLVDTMFLHRALTPLAAALWRHVAPPVQGRARGGSWSRATRWGTLVGALPGGLLTGHPGLTGKTVLLGLALMGGVDAGLRVGPRAALVLDSRPVSWQGGGAGACHLGPGGMAWLATEGGRRNGAGGDDSGTAMGRRPWAGGAVRAGGGRDSPLRLANRAPRSPAPRWAGRAADAGGVSPLPRAARGGSPQGLREGVRRGGPDRRAQRRTLAGTRCLAGPWRFGVLGCARAACGWRNLGVSALVIAGDVPGPRPAGLRAALSPVRGFGAADRRGAIVPIQVLADRRGGG